MEFLYSKEYTCSNENMILSTLILYELIPLSISNIKKILDFVLNEEFDFTVLYDLYPLDVKSSIRAYYFLLHSNYNSDLFQLIKINLDSKINELLKSYLKNPSFNLFNLYLLLRFKNKKDFDFLVMDDNSNNITNYDDNSQTNNNTQFMEPDSEFLKIDIQLNSKFIIKPKYNKENGQTSKIIFYRLPDIMIKDIEENINFKLNSNIVVQKIYIETDNIWLNRLGGRKYLFKQEIYCLKKLYKKKHFPLLLNTSYRKTTFTMDYCGKPINSENLPLNWKDQLKVIVETLHNNYICHNDVCKHNFLVRDNIIMLIDFGWGTESRYYPYINIDIKNYLEYSDFFQMLNDVYQMSIINKKYFKEFKLWKQKY